MVDVREKVGWLVDRVEVNAVLPDALKSACQVGQIHRTAALAWLELKLTDIGDRLKLVSVAKTTTLAELAHQYPAVPVERLAIWPPST